MIDKVAPGVLNWSSSEVPRSATEVVSEINTLEKHVKSSQAEGINKDELYTVVDELNRFVSTSNTHLKFEFHDQLQEYYVTIVDDVTRDVVKEIPAKKMLDIFASMREYTGILVDKKI
ncbi:flagellar protein FlaG [Rossellomorea marisflavi]|uniref:flagellar protein FlaG n=1 Tax=Rossellomorea marisflavi TaxID=189381 RepID=UPI003457C387